MTTQAPIGVFDSGVGGLTVAREIRALLPNEHLIYYADNAHCPYGERPGEEVTALAAAAAARLLDEGVKLIVVACNSASGAALHELRRRYPVPFVGMVPAIKPACALSARGRVGVLATTLTVQAELFSDVVTRFARDCRLTIQTCPGLAEAIERGEIDTPATREMVRAYLRPLKAAAVDVVVLGCTHYPYLRPTIEREMGEGVVVVDSGAAVARQVRRVLSERDLLTDREEAGTFRLLASGHLSVARRLAAGLGLVETPLPVG
ncbi:MAG: glutamate racemase [Chloroflexota bacterium]|nr:glutamate racemase [Dehalococcoidia bacterium]MDW8254259.1 glutamate racemase [Chloroflexota bacterium]